jgi:hypothetical protein
MCEGHQPSCQKGHKSCHKRVCRLVTQGTPVLASTANGKLGTTTLTTFFLFRWLQENRASFQLRLFAFLSILLVPSEIVESGEESQSPCTRPAPLHFHLAPGICYTPPWASCPNRPVLPMTRSSPMAGTILSARWACGAGGYRWPTCL